jgi:hypothetical protein
MAGLIARLFGGKPSPAVDMEPAPGIGGYHLGPGPANQSGFPGSTSQTRTFPGRNPTQIGAPDWTGIKAQTNFGFDQAMGTTPEIRQASYRGTFGRGGGQGNSPRSAPVVDNIPQTAMRQSLQHNAPNEFYGGPMLKTGPGNDTAGAYINRTGATNMGLQPADQRDTTTPWIYAQPQISGNVPGGQNVRNGTAQRYKNAPGDVHVYKSAPRADQAPVNAGGQATDGNVHPDAAVQDVAVPNRAVFPEITWSVLREMPYGGRGNGARGADLNGQRYYASGQGDQFWNAGQGEYGIERVRGSGNKRPVAFTQPAPWNAQFYDTTADVGTQDSPNSSPAQQAQAVYYSPGGLRASNSTGRTG